MTTSRTEEFNQHHVWLDRAFGQQPASIGAVSLQLWELLAQELTGIIGETGFESLYSRCVYLARDEFPWLKLDRSPTPIATRFIELEKQFNQHDSNIAEQASRKLFDVFMRLLSRLIGSGLTLNILQVAWDGVFSAIPDIPSDRPEHE